MDGCDKLCAKRGTEQYSGRVSASLVVSDILGDRAQGCHRSAQRTRTRRTSKPYGSSPSGSRLKSMP